MKLIKPFIISFYYLIISIFWISFHFFIRLILERIPYKISTDVSMISILFAFFLLCFHLYMLNTLFFYNTNILKKETSFIINLKLFLNIIYWNPLKYFHDKIIKNLPYSGYLWEDISNVFCQYLQSKAQILFIIIICNYLPRLIVASAFLIDVCYYNRFAYLYIFAVLIIIPLTFNALLYILDNFSIRNRNSLEEELLVSYNNKDQTYSFQFRAGIGTDFNALQEYQTLWMSFNTFVYLYDLFKSINNKYQSYLLLYTSSCYVIGWSYYLWFILDPSTDTFNFIFDIYDTIEPFSGHDL